MAHESKALKTRHLQRVVVDTTVQPEAVTLPMDVKLRYRTLLALVQLAKAHHLPLRQSYVRVAKKALMMSGRYRHANPDISPVRRLLCYYLFYIRGLCD